MADKSSEIVNLEKLYNYFKGKLPNLEEELKHLINAEDDNVILLYSRRCLEIIVTDLCEKELETYWAIWTFDLNRIVFNSNLDGEAEVNLFWRRTDGTSPATPLTDSKYHQQPKCWSADHKTLIYTEGINPETGIDIWMLRIEGDTTPKPLFNSRFNETHPTFSQDGRWLAYVSDEPGREEVFVCLFPELSNFAQISTEGGMEPLWAPDGKEIFYRDASGDRIMAVSFESDPELHISKPSLLFQGKYKGSSGPWGRNEDLKKLVEAVN
jgi:Tol biopolymer transport system component